MNCTTQRVTLERGNNLTEDLKLFEIYLKKNGLNVCIRATNEPSIYLLLATEN